MRGDADGGFEIPGGQIHIRFGLRGQVPVFLNAEIHLRAADDPPGPVVPLVRGVR